LKKKLKNEMGKESKSMANGFISVKKSVLNESAYKKYLKEVKRADIAHVLSQIVV
jgi:hypothetical protein